MNEWQPIETAPKDGTPVLVFVPKAWGKHDEIHVGKQRRFWVVGNQFYFDIGNPTHWMPLPEPPK
jgi:hypothetical protein